MEQDPRGLAHRFALYKAMSVERILQLLDAFHEDLDGLSMHLPNVAAIDIPALMLILTN